MFSDTRKQENMSCYSSLTWDPRSRSWSSETNVPMPDNRPPTVSAALPNLSVKSGRAWRSCSRFRSPFCPAFEIATQYPPAKEGRMLSGFPGSEFVKGSPETVEKNRERSNIIYHVLSESSYRSGNRREKLGHIKSLPGRGSSNENLRTRLVENSSISRDFLSCES